jgi:hypothetical protein
LYKKLLLGAYSKYINDKELIDNAFKEYIPFKSNKMDIETYKINLFYFIKERLISFKINQMNEFIHIKKHTDYDIKKDYLEIKIKINSKSSDGLIKDLNSLFFKLIESISVMMGKYNYEKNSYFSNLLEFINKILEKYQKNNNTKKCIMSSSVKNSGHKRSNSNTPSNDGDVSNKTSCKIIFKFMDAYNKNESGFSISINNKIDNEMADEQKKHYFRLLKNFLLFMYTDMYKINETQPETSIKWLTHIKGNLEMWDILKLYSDPIESFQYIFR